MSARKDSNQTVLDQAAIWTTLLESGEMSDAQRQHFHAWLEDPRHARALQEFRSLLGMIQDLPKRNAAPLCDLPPARFRLLTQLFAQPLWLSAVAAAAAIMVMGAWFSLRSVEDHFSQTYATETGGWRSVILPDGSIAQLNTRSRIRWLGARKDRQVVLEQGEVLFKVAHDPTKPFRVIVDNSEIRDLATEFDVYRKSTGRVVVTVLSGQVSVNGRPTGAAPLSWDGRRLSPNQQIEYTPSGLVADVHTVVAAKSVRWREGLLETEGQSFATVIEELGRYSTKPIVIADPRLSLYGIEGNGIGGTLSIQDVRAALATIHNLAPTVVVTETNDRYVLTYKGGASSPEPQGALQQNQNQNENAAGRP